MENPYYEKLVNTAIRFVSFRPRSRRELTDFLTKKMSKWDIVGEPLLQKVVSRMEELGYVDDRKFASWWIAQRSTFRPKGKRALMAELQQKGIAREIMVELLETTQKTQDSFDEAVSAQKAIERKLVIWAKMPSIEQKKKVYTFLAQRGFSHAIISRIIDGLGKKDYN
jgi:regulatory protein